MTLKNGSRRRRKRRRRILDNFQSTVFHPIELKAQIIHPSYSQQIDTKRQLSSSIFVIFLLKHRLAWKLEANREVLQWIAKDECRKDEDPLSGKRCAFVVKVLETARWTKRQRFNETDVGKEIEIGRERKRESGRGGKNMQWDFVHDKIEFAAEGYILGEACNQADTNLYGGFLTQNCGVVAVHAAKSRESCRRSVIWKLYASV